MTKKQFLSYFLIIKLIGYVIIPLVLLILPADFFDTGDSMCLSIMLLNMECYGCGITRAIMHLIHFDFEMAYAYNALSFIIFPILAYLWAYSFLQDVLSFKKPLK